MNNLLEENLYLKSQIEDLRREFLDKIANDKTFSKDQIPGILKSDYDFFERAIKIDGIWLRGASEELLKDDYLLTNALKNNGNLLGYVPEDITNNKKYVLIAIKDSPSTYEYIGNTLCTDIRLAFRAINKYPYALQVMSEEFKDNKKFVLKCLKRDGAVLEFASDRLKNDIEVIEAALKDNSSAIKHIGRDYEKDKNLAKRALLDDCYNYAYLSDYLKNDRQLLLIAMENYTNAWSYSTEKLKTELKEEFGSQDTIKAIKAYIMKEKLNEKIPNKTIVSKNKNKV